MTTEATSVAIADLVDGTFDAAVAEGVHLIDFWFEGCAPCRAIAPVIDKLAVEMAGKITISKVDLHGDSDEIKTRFEVTAAPTLLLLEDGELIARIPAGNLQKMVATITPLLP